MWGKSNVGKVKGPVMQNAFLITMTSYGRESVLNHLPHDFLLNRLFRQRYFTHKGPITRQVFPFDDVIMMSYFRQNTYLCFQGCWRFHPWCHCTNRIWDCCQQSKRQERRILCERYEGDNFWTNRPDSRACRYVFEWLWKWINDYWIAPGIVTYLIYREKHVIGLFWFFYCCRFILFSLLYVL